jgi:hypothetical protein
LWAATATLSFNPTIDLDLYLFKAVWSDSESGWQWVVDAVSTSMQPTETIQYPGIAGDYYAWAVHAYRGFGNYEICLSQP